MNSYLSFFDVETTGLDKIKDHIIQIAGVKIHKDQPDIILQEFCHIIKPPVPENNWDISEKSLELHGITKDRVMEKGVQWVDIADSLQNFFKDADISTYNGNRFDLEFLYKTLQSIPGLDKVLDFNTIQHYDIYEIETKLDSKKLEKVYHKYTGKVLEDSHNALSDIRATLEVYKGQQKHPDYSRIREEMNFTILCPKNSIYAENNKLYFSRGKYYGQEVLEVLSKDRQYFLWYFNNVGSDIAKETVRKYHSEIQGN